MEKHQKGGDQIKGMIRRRISSPRLPRGLHSRESKGTTHWNMREHCPLELYGGPASGQDKGDEKWEQGKGHLGNKNRLDSLTSWCFKVSG